MNDVLSALPSLVTILQQVPTDNLWTPLHVIQIAMQPGGLFDHLNVIVGFASMPGDKEDETDAAALIRFGRFGLHPVIDFLHDAYQLATVSLVLTRQQVATVAQCIDSVAVKMHSHILAFRTSHPRDVYDPTQVSFLCRMLEVHRHKFTVRFASFVVSVTLWLMHFRLPNPVNASRHWQTLWECRRWRITCGR